MSSPVNQASRPRDSHPASAPEHVRYLDAERNYLCGYQLTVPGRIVHDLIAPIKAKGQTVRWHRLQKKLRNLPWTE